MSAVVIEYKIDREKVEGFKKSFPDFSNFSHGHYSLANLIDELPKLDDHEKKNREEKNKVRNQE